MSCCPPAPQIKVSGSGDEDFAAQDTDIRLGESVECYMQRAGNTTGRHDDKTEDIPNKIENTDIPLTSTAQVNVTFRLTANSSRSATLWQMKDSGGNPFSNFSGTTSVTLVGSTLSGTFAAEYFGKQIKITISALDGAGVIDERGFTFSPAAGNGSNISFIHPLPGSIVTSRFGPRRPPTSGASSRHGGCDFAYGGGITKDVLAAADGEIEFAGTQNGGEGNYIKVRHLNGAGRHLCTSVYMHLNKIYVSIGQKVSAGQKIGLEGNTGVGTGAHLHFECRLPNGMKIDPVPLIRGELNVARETNPDNSAKEGTIEAKNSTAVLTTENVEAKQNGCEQFGPDYPKDPLLTTDPVPTTSPLTDPFELAWLFTMMHEVGPQWTSATPSDPEVAAGLIESAAQRKKTGYVNTPNYPGGETKFGIAQGPNPNIKVEKMQYDSAKQTGFNNYWKRANGSASFAATKPKTAIMLFDISFLHGPKNASTIKAGALILNKTDDESIVALAEAQQDFMRTIVIMNPQRVKYINGWLKRSRELLAYVQNLQNL